ncbi:unnamed protein product [Schistosoma mattheei]|uniref:Uncharacterized protein n=1 Tax=Schistosoma mattheei TaxID=31246 RepID=A0A183PUS8_9TREM|nr:unnamed protein product [Schistosoma mattheei]
MPKEEERKTKEHITSRNGDRHEKNEQQLDRTIECWSATYAALGVTGVIIELLRVLMGFDIADDILMALITLLKPQHEIQLGKLFTEATSDDNDDEISSSHMDSNEESYRKCN